MIDYFQLDQQELRDLEAASGEQEYADGKVQEGHDMLVDLIPLMTNEQIEAFIKLMEVELRERDMAELDDLPF